MKFDALQRSTSFAATPTGRTVLTIAATTLTILSIQRLSRLRLRKALRVDVEAAITSQDRKRRAVQRSDTASTYDLDLNNDDEQATFDDSIIREFLARNYAFLGEEGCQKVRDSFVVVVGLGGVGSMCATMLARSGVGKIRIIDFDQVTLSSLNRHAAATLADVGTPKVQCCKSYLKKIAPWIKVDARNELWRLEDAEALLEGKPDWVVDCIDNIGTKIQLLKYCKDHDLKVFSSMGAASKGDPTRIQIGDISVTYEDPLARAVRQKLKWAGITSGIPVVYSTEKPNEQTALLPLPEEEFQRGSVGELSALESFRVRILPCLGPLPGQFGSAAASYIVCHIGGARLRPLAVKERNKVYTKAYRFLGESEGRFTGSQRIALSEEDAAYLVDDLCRGRSVVAPAYRSPTNAVLVRWNRNLPLTWGNCVLMDREEAQEHEKRCLLGGEEMQDVWGAETCETVMMRQDEEKRLRKWRLL